jgi:hypothetical protein
MLTIKIASDTKIELPLKNFNCYSEISLRYTRKVQWTKYSTELGRTLMKYAKYIVGIFKVQSTNYSTKDSTRVPVYLRSLNA